MTKGKSGCGARSVKTIVASSGVSIDGRPSLSAASSWYGPGVLVAGVVEQVDDVGRAADDDLGGERPLDAVLDVAGGDRPAVLEPHALPEGEGPAQAVLGRRPEVGGEVGDELVGVPRLGAVGDQRADVEPHQVPHAGQVGALRVQAVDLGGDHAAGCRRSASEGARTPVTPASALPSTDRDVGLAAGAAAAADREARRRGRRRPRPRGRAGGTSPAPTRAAGSPSRSRVVFSTPAARPHPCRPAAAAGLSCRRRRSDRSARTRRRPGWRRRRAHRRRPARPGSRPCSRP